MSAVEFRNAAWVVLGGLLGTAICMVVVQRPTGFGTMDPVAFASLGVFVMLVRSAGSRAPHRPAAAN